MSHDRPDSAHEPEPEWASPGAPYPPPGAYAPVPPAAGSPPPQPQPGGYPPAPPPHQGHPAPLPAYPASGPPGYPASGPPGYPAPPRYGAPVPAYPQAGPPYPPHGPGGGYPGGFTAPTAPQPISAPARVEPVPGTEFGLAYFTVPPTNSGQAVGSLVAGGASILVSMVVGCFGLAGAKDGWGPLVGGAFAILAALAGGAAIGLGWFALGQVRRSGGRLVGRAVALAGMWCGTVGLGLTALAMVLALLI